MCKGENTISAAIGKKNIAKNVLNIIVNNNIIIENEITEFRHGKNERFTTAGKELV